MNILITGGTGFLGQELVKHFYKDENTIRVIARNEGKLIELKQKFPNIEICTGDIADEWITDKAMQGIDEVYHLAAVKNVEIAENEVYNTVKTNIVGTLELLKAVKKHKPKLFLAVSTDKASQPKGIYGCSKKIMEGLIQEAEKLNEKTKYRIVRYGNVLYSTGSVLVKWREKMQRGEKIQITNPEMTRYFFTVNDAINLIDECISEAIDSTPYIPTMKGVSIQNLCEAMMQKYGRVEVEEIGNRGGENLHETMDGLTFSNTVGQYTIEELKEIL
jgi:UDP-N-acetylglucosamine 4,6-dehydratase